MGPMAKTGADWTTCTGIVTRTTTVWTERMDSSSGSITALVPQLAAVKQGIDESIVSLWGLV